MFMENWKRRFEKPSEITRTRWTLRFIPEGRQSWRDRGECFAPHVKLQEHSRENISVLSQSCAEINETQGADVLSIHNINFNMFQYVQAICNPVLDLIRAQWSSQFFLIGVWRLASMFLENSKRKFEKPSKNTQTRWTFRFIPKGRQSRRDRGECFAPCVNYKNTNTKISLCYLRAGQR